MLRLGLHLTVSLGALLVMGFLALSPGHKASATPDISGKWASVYSEDMPMIANEGDCATTWVQDTSNHYTYDPLGPAYCESGGVTTAIIGFDATLDPDLTFHGMVTFTGAAVVTFSGTMSGDGNSLSGGVWDYPAASRSGTFSSARRVVTVGTNQTATGSGGSSLTFVGTGTSDTSIITASTSGGVVPPQFQLVPASPPLYYHVITTPDPAPPGSGPYTFCVSYPDSSPNDGIVDGTGTNETDLHVAHAEGGIFNGSYPPYFPGTDYAANVVCAQVSSLSEFALVGPGSVGGLVSIVSGDSSGVGTWLWAASIAGAITLATAGGWFTVARRRLR